MNTENLAVFGGKVLLVLLISTSITKGVEYRTIDGSNNNLGQADFGRTGSQLLRLAPARYADGIGNIDMSRPNPRDISNLLFDQNASLPDERNLSEWAWAWGQFIDHDIDHSLIDASNGVAPIMIPVGDPVFDNGTTNLAGQTINLSRTAFAAGTGITTPREQVNNISSWLDGSAVYGGRAVDGPAGVDRATYLRSGVGGKLKVSDGGALGDMLPVYVDGVSPVMANTHRPSMTGTNPGDKAFVAGDVRANEHSALTGLHTLFVREHNRLASIIVDTNPSLDDEAVYQFARKIVSSQLQAITYNEYLPAMGVPLSPYSGYDDSVDPTTSNEFANAAFRMGHSQINGTMLRLDAAGNEVPQGHLDLVDSFFYPDELRKTGLEPIFRGLAAQVQEATDAKLVGGLRNQLFKFFLPGIGLIDNATDLASINVMRGRDHGLGTYNETRAALGLPQATSFADISSDTEVQNALAAIYSDVDELDLYVALLSEDHTADSSLGETTNVILADQFERIRNGDRFWYQHSLDDVNLDLVEIANWGGDGDRTAIDWLESLSLSDVIQLNTQIDSMQANVFFAQTVPEPNGAFLMLLSTIAFGVLRRRTRVR